MTAALDAREVTSTYLGRCLKMGSMRNLSWVSILGMAAALGGGCTSDEDPPVLAGMTPEDSLDTRGARAFTVVVGYTDESPVHVSMQIDGEEQAAPEPECTDEGCTAEAELVTAGLAIGDHELEVVLEDAAGNTTRAVRTISVDDILTITSLQVTGETDGAGPLELEVYAFTEAGMLIGCAGSRHGLINADYSDIAYPLDASLINMMGDKLATLDLATSRIRLEVWEDDDEPVCPAEPALQGNTRIGASPAYTVEEWRAQAMPISFERVTALSVEWTRDLPEPPGKDMAPPPEDDPFDWGKDGGGCATTGGSSSGALALVLAGLIARRRRRERS